MDFTLDFEKPFAELMEKISDLKQATTHGDVTLVKEIKRLEKRAEEILCNLYKNLNAWQIVHIARHPKRPHTSDYIAHLIDDFTPLAGDRMYAEDSALIGGLGRFKGTPVMVLGHEKGKDTDDRIKRNFGMPKPEGYRKAKRLMDMCERFRLPLLCFVDTAGAHPGVDAEERGQSEAIAACIEKSLSLNVPVISTVIGEGGSGGAVALATANIVLMLEYAIYSVVSPEGCASILWRTKDKAPDAAEALKLTSPYLKKWGVVDQVITEPPGAAHRNAHHVINAVGDALAHHLKHLKNLNTPLKTHRQERFIALGRFEKDGTTESLRHRA